MLPRLSFGWLFHSEVRRSTTRFRSCPVSGEPLPGWWGSSSSSLSHQLPAVLICRWRWRRSLSPLTKVYYRSLELRNLSIFSFFTEKKYVPTCFISEVITWSKRTFADTLWRMKQHPRLTSYFRSDELSFVFIPGCSFKSKWTSVAVLVLGRKRKKKWKEKVRTWTLNIIRKTSGGDWEARFSKDTKLEPRVCVCATHNFNH